MVYSGTISRLFWYWLAQAVLEKMHRLRPGSEIIKTTIVLIIITIIIIVPSVL